ncbi:uncharacterized protein [Rutidosis leptorrhynchoides]|uniref:uncharacterized protein n=1 Tax=Rutidosis leptorrhynchoides TaxID=125765 RepID=UPI003A9A212C
MDRSEWMYNIGRTSIEYMKSLDEFITIAETDQLQKGNEKIICPCKKCFNGRAFNDSTEIRNHLILNGFMRGYTCWSYHGESLVDHNRGDSGSDEENEEDSYGSDMDHDNFEAMFEDMEDNVDGNCTNFTKLSAVIQLLNLQANNGWSDTSFTSLLELLHKMLPEANEFPVSTYHAKKIICPMGLEIHRIHACPNDCMLYRNEDENHHECKVCGTSRYKSGKPTEDDNDVTENGPPAKVLWYFPIIPRLKRLYSNAKHAKLLRWHAEERKKDGK